MINYGYLGHRLPQQGENSILSGRPPRMVEREPHVIPEVAFMLPLGCAMEAPQDQVMFCIVP